MDKVLWAVRVGEPDWAEEIITEVAERIPAASEWARANGFDRLRVADVDLTTPPDFAGTVEV